MLRIGNYKIAITFDVGIIKRGNFGIVISIMDLKMELKMMTEVSLFITSVPRT